MFLLIDWIETCFASTKRMRRNKEYTTEKLSDLESDHDSYTTEVISQDLSKSIDELIPELNNFGSTGAKYIDVSTLLHVDDSKVEQLLSKKSSQKVVKSQKRRDVKWTAKKDLNNEVDFLLDLKAEPLYNLTERDRMMQTTPERTTGCFKYVKTTPRTPTKSHIIPKQTVCGTKRVKVQTNLYAENNPEVMAKIGQLSIDLTNLLVTYF